MKKVDGTTGLLVAALEKATKEGTAKWEVATSDTEFAVANPAGTVFIGMERIASAGRTRYTLTLLNESSEEILRISTATGDDLMLDGELFVAVLARLYVAAEKLAKDIDNTVARFIKGL